MIRALFVISAMLLFTATCAEADSVVGSGTIGYSNPFTIAAYSGPYGENATGNMWTYIVAVDEIYEGTVTGLCVNGNQAVIIGSLAPNSDEPYNIGFEWYVQDNAAAGTRDLVRLHILGYLPLSCPPFQILPPAAVTSGDIAVVDDQPPDQAPVADLSATPMQVISPNNVDAVVTLDGSRSFDPDGDALTYTWFVDGSGVGTGAQLSVTLAVGPHDVELDVSDGKGRTDTKAVVVTVITAAQAVNNLAAEVDAASIPAGIKNTLLDDLKVAAASFTRGNFKAAVNQLQEFIADVGSQSGKKIDTATADVLIAAAQAIIEAVTGA